MSIKKIFIRIYIICTLMAYSIFGYSQRVLPIFFNDSIEYEFGYVGMRYINRKEAMPSKYIVLVDLTKNQRIQLNKISKSYWLRLLSDKKTDWASNLLLYYLNERDASDLYAVIKNRRNWILLKKNKEDINYWKRKLK